MSLQSFANCTSLHFKTCHIVLIIRGIIKFYFLVTPWKFSPFIFICFFQFLRCFAGFKKFLLFQIFGYRKQVPDIGISCFFIRTSHIIFYHFDPCPRICSIDTKINAILAQWRFPTWIRIYASESHNRKAKIKKLKLFFIVIVIAVIIKGI